MELRRANSSPHDSTHPSRYRREAFTIQEQSGNHARWRPQSAGTICLFLRTTGFGAIEIVRLVSSFIISGDIMRKIAIIATVAARFIISPLAATAQETETPAPNAEPDRKSAVTGKRGSVS